MANDDEAARRARAAALRQRITALKSTEKKSEASEKDSRTQGSGSKKKKTDDDATPAESPREFIDRRMRELDHDKCKDDTSDT